jgi:hypothetical protein
VINKFNKEDIYMKKLFTLVLILSLGVSSLAGIGFAEEESVLSSEQEIELRQKLVENGTKEKKIDALIEKLKRGELWDSMNPDKVSKVPEHKLIATMEDPEKFHRFPDGSYIKSSISIPEQEVGIQGCYTGFCKLKGLTVSRDDGTLEAEFKADITLQQGAEDKIDLVYDGMVTKWAGSLKNEPEPTIIRAIEDTRWNQPAYANMKIVTETAGAYTNTNYLKLYVGNDDHWTDATW